MSGFWLAARRLRAGRRTRDPIYKAFVESPLPQRGTLFDDAELVCPTLMHRPINAQLLHHVIQIFALANLEALIIINVKLFDARCIDSSKSR